MFTKKKAFSMLAATAVALSSGATVTPSVSAAPSDLKTCEGTNYGTATNVGQIRGEFDKRFGPPNKKGVWQAKDDAAVWDAWCFITGSSALLDMTATPPKIVSDNRYPLDEDGVTVGFRAGSKSGGYTIDVNAKNLNQGVQKVHVGG